MKDSNRQEQNLILIEILGQLAKQYPDLRFSQILDNFGFVVRDCGGDAYSTWKDEFHVEPIEILNRVKKQLERVSQ